MSEAAIVPLPTRRATVRLAQRLAPLLRKGDLIVLEGDLGAGKTFFARALCRALGVDRAIPIRSPTFALVHELEGASATIAHADLYRLAGGAELEPLGLREARAEGCLLLVEWGGPYAASLGGDALIVSLSVREGRSARLEATGPRASSLLADLAAAPRRP